MGPLRLNGFRDFVVNGLSFRRNRITFTM